MPGSRARPLSTRSGTRTGPARRGPASTGLGHRQVQRWNLPEGWVISRHPAHAALVSEADFIAAQDAAAPRGPAGPAVRRYLLAGLLACGRCGRKLESAWSNGKPAYRYRHGYISATRCPQPGRLAAGVAGRVAGRFADGVWLVALAPVQDPVQVPAAVAAALGVRGQPGVPVAGALARVLGRRQVLLVLDNCEHVVAAAAGLCAGLR